MCEDELGYSFCGPLILIFKFGEYFEDSGPVLVVGLCSLTGLGLESGSVSQVRRCPSQCWWGFEFQISEPTVRQPLN
jgi:hypothetical protein